MMHVLDKQREWIYDLEYLDPYWDRAEFDLRNEAAKLQEGLDPASPYGTIRVVRMQPIKAFANFGTPTTPLSPASTYREDEFPVLRVGGGKELLLIEECLRRASAGIGW